jgi:HPt (histidine-containing phosphotransfer) domain-containing protein
MESAVAAKNYDKYLENIHALKGSAGSIGAQKIFLHCKQTLLQEPRTQNFIENLKNINSLFELTEDALSRYTETNTHSLASGKSG